MMNLIEKIEGEQINSPIPDFAPGDTVRVHQLIREGGKERVQVFEGVVIRRNGGRSRATFTVRKVSYSIGVERVFPLHSPRIQKIEVKQRGHVRRAKLYYLRDRSGKAARIQEARYKPTNKSQTEPKQASAAQPKEAAETTQPPKESGKEKKVKKKKKKHTAKKEEKSG